MRPPIDAPAAVAPVALLDLINAGWTTQAVAAACELGLPERLADGPRDAAALARDLGVDADALARLLRALSTIDICRETGDGRFGLGTLGPWLRAGVPGGLRHWAVLNGGRTWQHWATLAERVRRGDAPDGADRSALRFAQMAADPREAATFHGAMVELGARVADSLAGALTLPDGGCVVVDVGGSSGRVLAAVLARHPGVRGVLFDLAPALAGADALLQCHGVRERCTLHAGDFFAEVPAGGDVYLLKSVLHNWRDDQARAILARCRAVLAPAARLVIVERLRPERAGNAASDRGVARSDLQMLLALSGRERTRREFEALLAGAGLALHHTAELDGGFSAITAGGV